MKTSFLRPALTTLAALGLAALAGTQAHAQTVFTAWTFNNDTGAPNTTPATSTGTGTASTLGMTNSYPNAVAATSTGSTDASDVFTAVPATDGNSSDPGSNLWRIRGAGTNADGTKSGNGWNSAAPQYTQGAQFTTSTAGESNIVFSFDWAATTQGVNTLQVQYTTDGVTYQNFTGTNGTLTFASFSTGQPWLNGNTIDFSGITAANNDANFGVRLVSAYYPSTTAYQATTGTALNNKSGNWRFDDVTFSGAPLASAPEPSGFVVLFLGAGALGLAAIRRRTGRIAV